MDCRLWRGQRLANLVAPFVGDITFNAEMYSPLCRCMKMNNSDMTIPTEAELLARAVAMIPWLREKAGAVEAARMVPKDTIQAFTEAGFFKILQPKRWGGYEMNPNVLNKVLMELARGCPSSAWNVMVLGVHPFEVGLLDPRCGDELWGENNTALVSSSYAPFGTVKLVDGGYVLNGEWLTSSGCDHAAGGAFLGGRVADKNGEKTMVIDNIEEIK